ncbi:MAG: response regulator [candidate division KSB1 bacterium]|nr:response regulator [candidate division KSB1 bacterium]
MSDGDFAKCIEILLIEDNPGDVGLTEAALEENKMRNQLHVAKDGEEAMQFLFKQDKFSDAPRPDLIILDLNMPKKDGRDVLKEIKTNPDLKKIPVVILTSSKAEKDIIKSYNLHANCYIKKPLDFEQFIQVVQSIEHFWMSIVVLPESE